MVKNKVRALKSLKREKRPEGMCVCMCACVWWAGLGAEGLRKTIFCDKVSNSYSAHFCENG